MALHRHTRDFTMLKAGVLVLALSLVHVLGGWQPAEGGIAQEDIGAAKIMPALFGGCDTEHEAGPLI